MNALPTRRPLGGWLQLVRRMGAHWPPPLTDRTCTVLRERGVTSPEIRAALLTGEVVTSWRHGRALVGLGDVRVVVSVAGPAVVDVYRVGGEE